MILALIRGLGPQYNPLTLTVHANLSNLTLDDVISQLPIFDNILIAQEDQTSNQLPPNPNVSQSNISQNNNKDKSNSNQGYRGGGKQNYSKENQFRNGPRRSRLLYFFHTSSSSHFCIFILGIQPYV